MGRWSGRMFTLVLGGVHVFLFLNVKDGPSRYRMTGFYTVMVRLDESQNKKKGWNYRRVYSHRSTTTIINTTGQGIERMGQGVLMHNVSGPCSTSNVTVKLYTLIQEGNPKC